MTTAGILYNLERLKVFLRDKSNAQCPDTTVDEFLGLYTRIMDLHGGPREGWGMIFLEFDDFNEVVEYVRVNDKETRGGVKDYNWLSHSPENERKHGITALINGYWMHFIHINKI